jgi:hypothetical protein
VTETSRLSTTAHALGQALEALAEALAQVRPEAIEASEHEIQAQAQAFTEAAADAVRSGDTLAPAQAVAVTAALARCRRLGFSLSLLTGLQPAVPDAPRGYTPVGRPLTAPGGGAFLTARG